MIKGTIITCSIVIIVLSCRFNSGINAAESERTINVFGKLKTGFQLAGKLLGIDQSSGVAQLVSEAFGKTQKHKGDHGPEMNTNNNIFSGFLRILGFNASKIGAIAVNAIIFVAQLISTSLSRPSPSQLTQARRLQPGTPLDWIMNKTYVTEMFEHINDADLPNLIIGYIKERSMDEETDCIQLLVCKLTPFVRGMQKTVSEPKNSTVKGRRAFYAHFPTINEVANNGDRCDLNHSYCFLNL